MRPAQKAPENARRWGHRWSAPCSFNEAGAKSAGKPARERRGRRRSESFNEAGAKSAGKRLFSTNKTQCNHCFNEAGAKSAGKRCDRADEQDLRRVASMRPAQKAPENNVAAPAMCGGRESLQ